MKNKVINVEEVVLYEPTREELDVIIKCCECTPIVEEYKRITIRKLGLIWRNIRDELYYKRWQTNYDENPIPYNITQKFYKALRKANTIGIVIPNYKCKSMEMALSWFDTCKFRYKSMCDDYDLVCPTLEESKLFYLLLTTYIRDNPTCSSKIFMLRKNVYKYVKRVYKVDLLKGDK